MNPVFRGLVTFNFSRDCGQHGGLYSVCRRLLQLLSNSTLSAVHLLKGGIPIRSTNQPMAGRKQLEQKRATEDTGSEDVVRKRGGSPVW